MALQLLSWLEARLLLARPLRLLGALSLQTAPRPTVRSGANIRAWTAEKYRRFDRGERMTADWIPT
jgi:hypothetical protein